MLFIVDWIPEKTLQHNVYFLCLQRNIIWQNRWLGEAMQDGTTLSKRFIVRHECRIPIPTLSNVVLVAVFRMPS